LARPKKEKVTFGLVVLYVIVFIVADVVIALSPFKPVLFALGSLEIIGLGYLILRAIWNAFPKGVQKGLTRLSKT
jgi:hypothetical protein